MATLKVIPFVDKKAKYIGKGMVVRAGKSAEYGTVRVQMEGSGFSLVNGAVLKQSPRACAVLLPLELIEGIKAGDDLNAILEGFELPTMTVVYQESFEPFYEEQQPAQTKDGVEKLINGEQYYFRALCAEVGTEEAKDVRLAGVRTVGEPVEAN